MMFQSDTMKIISGFLCIGIIFVGIFILIASCTTAQQSPAMTPTAYATISLKAPTQSIDCLVFVEGNYTTRADEGDTYATLETTGGGNAILTVNVSGIVDAYTITYQPSASGDPCYGMYTWQGFSGKTPVSGTFGVTGQNPDEILFIHDAAGNYKELEMVRV